MVDKEKLKKEAQEELNRAIKSFHHFWDVNYQTLTWEDKISTWVKIFKFSMRMSGESGQDEYSEFTPTYFQEMLRIEPEAKKVISLLGNFIFQFDEKKVMKQMGIE